MTLNKTLLARPLTAEAFHPYGDVIETEDVSPIAINNGTTERFHDLAKIQFEGDDARPIVSIFRGQPVRFPLMIKILERHPLGSQAFFPLDRRPYLVIVAEPADSLEGLQIRAFHASGNQGVNYHQNVWHHPLLTLDQESDFLVIDRAGPGQNCEEIRLPHPLNLELTR